MNCSVIIIFSLKADAVHEGQHHAGEGGGGGGQQSCSFRVGGSSHQVRGDGIVKTAKGGGGVTPS